VRAFARLCENEIRTEAWQNYVADSLWVLATHRAGTNHDGTPAYQAFSVMMHDADEGRPAPRGDERTAEQVKNDLLAKLDRLAGDE